MNIRHEIGVAAQIGRYCDAVEVPAGSRLLFISGTPGLENGVVPVGIKAQAELAWRHVFSLLESAGMGPEDLVKITQYLTRAEDVPLYSQVRTQMLGNHRPASMLAIVPALVRPDFLVEIEAYAARK